MDLGNLNLFEAGSDIVRFGSSMSRHLDVVMVDADGRLWYASDNTLADEQVPFTYAFRPDINFAGQRPVVDAAAWPQVLLGADGENPRAQGDVRPSFAGIYLSRRTGTDTWTTVIGGDVSPKEFVADRVVPMVYGVSLLLATEYRGTIRVYRVTDAVRMTAELDGFTLVDAKQVGGDVVLVAVKNHVGFPKEMYGEAPLSGSFTFWRNVPFVFLLTEASGHSEFDSYSSADASPFQAVAASDDLRDLNCFCESDGCVWVGTMLRDAATGQVRMAVAACARGGAWSQLNGTMFPFETDMSGADRIWLATDPETFRPLAMALEDGSLSVNYFDFATSTWLPWRTDYVVDPPVPQSSSSSEFSSSSAGHSPFGDGWVELGGYPHFFVASPSLSTPTKSAFYVGDHRAAAGDTVLFTSYSEDFGEEVVLSYRCRAFPGQPGWLAISRVTITDPSLSSPYVIEVDETGETFLIDGSPRATDVDLEYVLGSAPSVLRVVVQLRRFAAYSPCTGELSYGFAYIGLQMYPLDWYVTGIGGAAYKMLEKAVGLSDRFVKTTAEPGADGIAELLNRDVEGATADWPWSKESFSLVSHTAAELREPVPVGTIAAMAARFNRFVDDCGKTDNPGPQWDPFVKFHGQCRYEWSSSSSMSSSSSSESTPTPTLTPTP